MLLLLCTGTSNQIKVHFTPLQYFLHISRVGEQGFSVNEQEKKGPKSRRLWQCPVKPNHSCSSWGKQKTTSQEAQLWSPNKSPSIICAPSLVSSSFAPGKLPVLEFSLSFSRAVLCLCCAANCLSSLLDLLQQLQWGRGIAPISTAAIYI